MRVQLQQLVHFFAKLKTVSALNSHLKPDTLENSYAGAIQLGNKQRTVSLFRYEIFQKSWSCRLNIKS